MRTLVIGFIASSALLVCGARAAPVPDGGTRDQFMAAIQRIQSKRPDLPDSPALIAYVIYDYLVAARLRRDLQQAADDALDGRIDAFIVAHTGQPVIRTLRRDWLTSLGARRRWDWFLPRSADANEPALICLRLAGRLASGDTEGLAAAALARWRLPQAQPTDCDPVFAWLRQQNLLTPALAEERTRGALAADSVNAAREFVKDVPAPQNAPLLQWLQLLKNPRPELEALARDAALSVEPRALVAGYTRLTLTDYSTAARLLPAILDRAELADDAKGQLRRAAALGGAYSRDPGAVAAFDQLPAGIADTAVQEWRVRAALWIGNFAKALAWIERMPADLAAQPRWRYWRARALEQAQSLEAARPSLKELAAVRDYYGYLAADRLDATYQLNAHPLRIDAGIQKSLAANEGLARARELFHCDFYDEAEVEWAVALANANAGIKTQAAILASRWGWYAQSIAELARLGQWDDVGLRYPHPFDSAVARAGQRTRVPGDWIYAVMRQESLYRQEAVSSAGARGLLQVLPTTAAALAKRWNVKLPTRDTLFDPAVATLIGAAHLRELLDDHGGALPLGLAAYNAGSVPVARWHPAASMDADIWIENIPYPETRAYVQRVLEHIVAFAWVRKAPLPRLSSLMPQVESRGNIPGGTLKACRSTSATLGGSNTSRRSSVRRMCTFRRTTSTLTGSTLGTAGHTTRY